MMPGQIQRELKTEERLIWSGRSLNKKGNPRTGSTRLQIVIFGGVIASFIGLWLSSALDIALPILPLMLLPIGMAIGFLTAGTAESRGAYDLSRSTYALTNRRVFTIHDGFRNRGVKSLPLEYVQSVRMQLRTENRGNISFIAQPPRVPPGRPSMASNSPVSGSPPSPFSLRWAEPLPYLRFVLIGDPDHVCDLVEQARAHASTDAA